MYLKTTLLAIHVKLDDSSVFREIGHSAIHEQQQSVKGVYLALKSNLHYVLSQALINDNWPNFICQHNVVAFDIHGIMKDEETHNRAQSHFKPYHYRFTRVATETTESNSRTFLGHFPRLFQDCLRFFFTGHKF